MKVASWVRIRELFDQVVVLPELERTAFLDRACAAEPELRAEVERMLRSDEEATGFLDEPASILENAILPQVGTRIGRYTLKRVLASGGMGTVFEAVQDEPRRTVALKTLRLGLSSPETLQRFRFEAEVLGNLRHPSIAQIFEAGTHEEAGEVVPYFAMELVSGARDLVSYVREEDLALPEKLELFLEVCAAVQHGHQKGVIHRDLKPGNILVDSEGRAKVIDFGVARWTDPAAARLGDLATQTGQVLGTFGYMAPEQLAGGSAAVDVRSDVYALGVVLFELVEGRRPHELEDKSPAQALRTIQEEIPRPSTSTPRELGWILSKALAKEPERRYGSASDLAADLVRFVRHEPVLAGPPSVRYRLGKFVRRHRVFLTATAAVVVALALGLVRAEREAQAATKRADEVLRLSALQKLDDLIAEADRLWPAHPENLRRYQDWLADAEKLTGELPKHEVKLAELRANAKPWTAEDEATRGASHPKLAELEIARRHAEFHRNQTAALEVAEPPKDPSPAEAGVDFAALPSDAKGLNGVAWRLVDPERKDWGGEARGLVLARRAVELAAASPSAERAATRDTLAWALFAAGRFHEAEEEEEKALEEAGAERKTEFEGYIEKLRKAIEEELAPEGEKKRTEHLAGIEREVERLEVEVSKHPEWTFDDSQDKWWHNQLGKLVSGLKAFADPSTGLLSDGISPEHSWGMRKRLEFARTIEERTLTGSRAGARWAEAIQSIANVSECPLYGGLRITPQLGLLPIGRDPNSGLWEFAHLQTGEPAERGTDGKLILNEETGLVFVLLPAGTFTMGAQRSDPAGPNYDPSANPDEGPVHAVTLSPFFLSKYEMTQGQWLGFVGRKPSQYGPHRYSTDWNRSGRKADLVHPVERVTWDDCTDVCRRLGLELPSEAQWEYGARAGTTTIWWSGNDKRALAEAGNVSDGYAKAHGGGEWGYHELDLDDGNTSHAPVGSYRANAFGLHDVIGNLWEWCADGFHFYEQASKKDPVSDPAGSSNRVTRGGTFGAPASQARSAARLYDSPWLGGATLGVRPARRVVAP